MKRINLLIFSIFCILLVGCASNKTKEVGTLEAFKNVCTNYSFNYYDKLSEYASQNVDYITGAIQATYDDITIEMVQYDSSDNAEKTQNEHISSFMTMKSPGAVINKEKGKNYYKYTMISNSYYMISSRIENTLIFSKVPLADKEKIENIINDMNY